VVVSFPLIVGVLLQSATTTEGEMGEAVVMPGCKPRRKILEVSCKLQSAALIGRPG